MNRSTRIFCAYTGIVLIWGSTWTSIKYEMASAAPITSVALRFLLAGAALWVASVAMRRSWSSLSWRVVFPMAFLVFAINYCLNYFAEAKVPPSITAVTFATMPFFVFLFDALFNRARPQPRMWVGALIAFIGVSIVSASGYTLNIGWYSLLPLGSAAFAALGQVLVKRRPPSDPLVNVSASMLLCGCTLLPLGMGIEHPPLFSLTTPAYVANLTYLAIFGSSIAFYLNFWLLGNISTAKLGLSALLFPVVALLMAVFLTHEGLNRLQLWGSIIVLFGAGVALVPNGRVRPIAVGVDCETA